MSGIDDAAKRCCIDLVEVEEVTNSRCAGLCVGASSGKMFQHQVLDFLM